ncbi:HPF/RaiA family ribosome-associated protein [Ramlibacter sp.]|uniref:HPF/RaiA family ribosome-associated protein n=1 Tax=Ramlibacter sp. TaxID=1917967 RepID=UPI002C352597|nr:HPF/RaiA family ribosome-associated protein [Ramlibacter sp.]HWI80752.1 HPF/RaiA family ribosome-associated protein [Ramlibacter sp.]
MQVQVNTGNGVDNKESLERWASDFLNEALARFRREITRIEVQLTDENRGKGGSDDKRCMLEARLTGHDPVAVNHHGETQDLAIRGACQKLLRALEHTLGKLDRHQHRDRESIRKSDSLIAEPANVDSADGA